MVEYVGLDSVFMALGDPTRRAILTRLKKAPATVTEVAQPFDMSLNAVSKHLKVLEGAGLIERKRVGREHHLSLNAEPLGRATRWLIDYQDFWEARIDKLDALLRAKKTR
jgi:DNA-binding transcriptional ArsR family regulator